MFLYADLGMILLEEKTSPKLPQDVCMYGAAPLGAQGKTPRRLLYKALRARGDPAVTVSPYLCVRRRPVEAAGVPTSHLGGVPRMYIMKR